MRIIDADSLLKGTEDHQFIDTHVIWNAPTVDAIPVEWIKENKNLARQVGAWQYELFLETLLKDWEEENEFDSRN